MSTRYVWDKTYAAQKYTTKRTEYDTSQFQGPFDHDTSFIAGNSYTLNPDTGEFSITSGRTYTNSYVYSQTNHIVQISVPSAKYLKPGNNNNVVYEGATSTITPELEHRKSGYVERKRRPYQGNVVRIA